MLLPLSLKRMNPREDAVVVETIRMKGIVMKDMFAHMKAMILRAMFAVIINSVRTITI
jgi:hypothetical protein